MEQVTNFSSWWKLNKEKYEKIGVNEIVAKSIWEDACDTFSDMLMDSVKKHLSENQ